MPVTLKCADCGHAAASDDETPRTCPKCDGTMKKPAYKAKSGPTSSDRESAKAKPAAGTKPAKKGKALSLDDEESEKGAGGNKRDDAAAKSLEIDPGFKDKKLMEQVDEELSRGEVLHWAGRMCPEIARKNAGKIALVGYVIAGVGVLFTLAFAFSAGFPEALLPLIFVVVGVGVGVFGKKAVLKNAEQGWYAVTNQRAIVYAPSAFGSGGEATTYEPDELKRMRVEKSKVVDGAGDLIFRTIKTVEVSTDNRGKSSTNTSTRHYGFLGVENVREVETLVHNILLEDAADRDDE
jgi:hypothetical protein